MAEYLSWLEDPAHTRGVVGSIPTSATTHQKGSLSGAFFDELIMND